ncbi:MAG TPA: DUF4124 domain-containing protein [Burkholderiales bacterium]|nr:DUF4124 domain-containing protein [Burkholderiales bacterium]
MRYLIPALALLLCQEAAAQLFKCTDAGGKVTYSSIKCADMGLRDAGEVKDRIQITPAPAPQTSGSPPRTRPQSVEEPAKPAAAAEPPAPERRCFTTSVKGKAVTRCNDKPDED